MNRRQTVAEISCRLPHLKRRDVAEVLEVMEELWLSELTQPGKTVTVGDLGRLSVEVQQMRSGGVIRDRLQTRLGQRAPRTLRRVYIRFRPTAQFRNAVMDAHIRHIKEGSDE